MTAIVVGVASLIALVALLAGGGSAKDDPSPPVPSPSPSAKLRTRVIASGDLPGSFAAKYGGSFSKWKELPAVNPGMMIVYKHWDPESDLEYGWFTEPASYYPPGKSEESGLSPWAVGQVVQLPPSWPG